MSDIRNLVNQMVSRYMGNSAQSPLTLPAVGDFSFNDLSVGADEYARKHKPAAGQLGLFEKPEERQKPLFSKKVDDEAGRWVTMRGARVYISSDDGRVLKGPKRLMGKTKEQIERESAGKGEGTEKPPMPKGLAEMGRIKGGRKDNRQKGLFEEINPGFKWDEDEDVKSVSPKPLPSPAGKSEEADGEPFALSGAPSKSPAKPTDFGKADGATKQGALFDSGKGKDGKGDLPGQELLFNSDAGDVGNPRTMENRAYTDEQDGETTYAGMSLDDAAKMASEHGHSYEEAKSKIAKKPSAWISVLQQWKDEEKAEKRQNRKDKRESSWKPNEDEQKILDFIGDGKIIPRSFDHLSWGTNKKAMNSLLKKGVIDRVDAGKEITYRVMKPEFLTNMKQDDSGPQDGDRDATGLVFRDGRWHRDDEDEEGKASVDSSPSPADIAAKARQNNESIWTAAKRELGVNSMAEIPPELRKQLADAMEKTPAVKAAPKDEPKPSAARARAMKAQEEKQSQVDEPKSVAAPVEIPSPLPAETETKKPRMLRTPKPSAKMEDFGEYIPGARKEGAKKLGPRAPKAEEEFDGGKKPAWAKPFEVSQIIKSSDKSEEGKWSITSQKQKDWMGQARQIGKFDTKEAAEKALPLLAVAQDHSVRKSNDGTFAIHRRIAKDKYPIVKKGFESEEAAQRYIAANPIEILEHKFPRYESLQYLERVQRTGPDLRGGKDIKPSDFQKDFNLRGGQFGNWQSGKDGQTALNHAFDSFHDLADALGLEKSAITLDGRLALGFGSQGTGGVNAARAHYAPDKRFINLTKMAGAGSLAHEWAHALDHMIAGSTQQKNGSSAVAMESWSLKKHARPEVVDAVKNLYDMMTAHTVEEAVAVPKNKYSEKMEKEDQERRERAKENNVEMAFPRTLDDFMWNARKGLESMARYKKKTLKPEDLKEFDDLSSKISGGDFGKGIHVEGASRFGGRMSFENLEKLNQLHKKMVGRGFHTNDDYSLGKQIYHKINSERFMQEREKQAEAGATEKKKRRTSFLNEAVELDKQRVGDYYTKPEEMLARAFEAYIADKLESSGRRSDYLIGKGKTNNDRYRAAGIGAPFPEGEERTRINAAFDRLFDTLKGNELKAASGKGESVSKDKYVRSEYSNTADVIRDVVQVAVDRYMSQENVPVDKYAHPLIHAAVGGLGHMAVQSLVKNTTLRRIAHAAVASAMAAWMASANAQNPSSSPAGNQPSMGVSAPATPFMRQKAGNAAIDAIVNQAFQNHQKNVAAVKAGQDPESVAADASASPAVPHSISNTTGARAPGVKPLKGEDEPKSASPSTSPAGNGKSGDTSGKSEGFNDNEHPRHPAGAPESKGGEFAPKDGVESGSESSSPSPRNYPDNLNKPADQQTNYSPPERTIESLTGGGNDGDSPAADEPKSLEQKIAEHRMKLASQKSEPGPKSSRRDDPDTSWKKAMNFGTERVQASKDAKSQERKARKQQEQQAKQQEQAVSFNPDQLEKESEASLVDGNAESDSPYDSKPKPEDFKREKDYQRALKAWKREKGAQRASITKKIAKSVVPEVAMEYELDHSELESAVNDAIAMESEGHKRQEEARKYVTDRGYNAGRINRNEDAGKDHSSTSLDEVASEWAGLYPEIAGSDESQWVDRMWNLAKAGKQDALSAGDENFVRKVAERLHQQKMAGGGFSSFPADPGPVYGQVGDVDFTPFHRKSLARELGLIVDRYLREQLVT